WLLKAYTRIATLINKEVLEGRIQKLQEEKNSTFPRFLKLMEKIKVAKLSETEIDYLVTVLREFPYFVVSDFVKRVANKSSKAFQNILFIIHYLERAKYFLNQHRVIQTYQTLHGNCEKMPDASPWIFISCKNKAPKEKITVEADYFFSIFQNVDDEDVLRLSKTFKFNDSLLDWLMAKLMDLDPQSKKFVKVSSSYVLPVSVVNFLAKRNQVSKLHFDLENYGGLSSKEKIIFLINVAQLPVSQSFLLEALKAENDVSVCISAVTLFNRILMPIQGKLSSCCSRAFEDVTFCPAKFSVLKLDELPPTVFALGEKCLRGLKGGRIKYPEIME
ncbi:MAG: hypothetical protein NZO16_06235, partial [Deltaproteobacteria bacterium]|nr:hypothetical protein [Deltaproteobacteria bacterium]